MDCRILFKAITKAQKKFRETNVAQQVEMIRVLTRSKWNDLQLTEQKIIQLEKLIQEFQSIMVTGGRL